MWNLKSDTNEFTDRLTDRESRLLAVGKRGKEGGTGIWGLADANAHISMDQQQRPTVWHRELCSASCDEP